MLAFEGVGWWNAGRVHRNVVTMKREECGVSNQSGPRHVYEVRPRRDYRRVDLISDALPFGRLWYVEVSDCEGRQDSGDLTWRGVMNQHGVQ